MDGVKGVARILERLAVVTLSPAVQPDGNERQQRQSLLAQLKFHAQQPHGVHQAAQQLHIHPVESQQLPQQTPPFPTTEDIEDQHRQNTGAVVVHHAQRTQRHTGEGHEDEHQQERPALSLPPYRLCQPDTQKPQQQRPDHVLVYRVEPCAAVHQVEGYLGEHREHQHPQGVFLKAVGVEIALHRHEGKDGEGQPPRAGQPFLRRKQGGPEVIHQHKGHGEDMERRRADVKGFFHRYVHVLHGHAVAPFGSFGLTIRRSPAGSPGARLHRARKTAVIIP